MAASIIALVSIDTNPLTAVDDVQSNYRQLQFTPAISPAQSFCLLP